jgi:hypothetical protein
MHYYTLLSIINLFKCAIFFLDKLSGKAHIHAMKKTLLQETYELLDKTDVPVAEIAKQTGTKQRWVYLLIERRFDDPGVNKVEAVNHYLKSAAR